jgi:PKD repeat protein
MRTIAILAAALVGLAVAPTALAAPLNDLFADATAVTSTPFTDTVDLTDAGMEPGEPQVCSTQTQSVWYRVTLPTRAVLNVGVSGGFGATFNLYRQFAPGFGGLMFAGCAGSFGMPLEIATNPGETVYVQAGNGFGGVPTFQLTITAVPPPVNDAFADATAIGSLPFGETVDMRAAGNEPGEPLIVGGMFVQQTAWYTFTPAQTASYTARGLSDGCCSSTAAAVYTGNAVGALTEVVARSSGQPAVFKGVAGTTYRIQLARPTDLSPRPSRLTLEETPPLQPEFFTQPSDPSALDHVQFANNTSDPVGMGVTKFSWSFGDGSTAEGCCPVHRYASDGDYTVEMRVESADGRTATVSKEIAVRTHDVAIMILNAPKSGTVDRTKPITVEVANTRYAERVNVVLMRGVPGGGYEPVGSLTQSVPVRAGHKTTSFPFAYTFTAEDAAIGKVTFRAVAEIVGARDALPADNDAVAPPTSVSR